MQPSDGWQGVAREWELAVAGWRALEDNPLWLLTQRMQQNGAPRVRRSRNAALLIWGGVLLALYGSIFATIVLASADWPDPEDFFAMLAFGLVAPLTGVFLLFANAQLTLQGQTWLGRERGDARNVQAAMLDPLLGLTALGAREVVLASLRALGPLLLWTAGAGAGAATLVLLAEGLGREEFWLGLAVAPLTFTGYFVSGALGGLVLLLLSFCLGLNSTGAGPRTALVCLLLLHQLCGFGFSFASLAVMDMGSGHLLETVGGALTAHVYILAACWSGLWMLLHVRSAGAGWLLTMPIIWVVGLYMLFGVVALYSAVTQSNFSWLNDSEALGSLLLGLLSGWGSINHFAPSSLATPYSLNDSSPDAASLLLMPVIYAMRIGLLGTLAVMGYRAANYCAALRLRAMD